MRGPRRVDTPSASLKKFRAPLVMMAMEAKKPSTTSSRAATPAQRPGTGVRVSIPRFSPSIMIIRKMAMARGVNMPLSQYRAAPPATTAINTRALRDTVEEGRLIGAFMAISSRSGPPASIRP